MKMQFSTQDTQPGVHGIAPQDFIDTIPAPRAELYEGYRIGLPSRMKHRPFGLDQQGRWPDAAHAASEIDDDSDDRLIGWGAFIPAFLSLMLVAACTALALLLRDFT